MGVLTTGAQPLRRLELDGEAQDDQGARERFVEAVRRGLLAVDPGEGRTVRVGIVELVSEAWIAGFLFGVIMGAIGLHICYALR